MISKFVLTFLLVSFTFIFLTFSFNILENHMVLMKHNKKIMILLILRN